MFSMEEKDERINEEDSGDLEEIIDETEKEKEQEKKKEISREKRDLLLEEEIERNSSNLHRFLMNTDTSSSLNQKEIAPIMNLEEDLPETKKEEEKKREEPIQIDYMNMDKEQKSMYQKHEIDEVSYMNVRNFITEEQNFKSNQKHLYESISSISSEMEFVQKAMKPKYIVPEKLKEEDFTKEKKRTVENVLDKMKENYKKF